MHEIVTLQFGHYANYVGTHFWNTQEGHFSYEQPNEDELEENRPSQLLNHDCLYRVGETQKGDATYTPRVLIYDLKGGFGSVKKYNKLYEALDAQAAQDQVDLSWDPTRMQTFQEEEYQRSAYQTHLEAEEEGAAAEEDEDKVELDKVNTWSDFNRVYYHPKSTTALSGYVMGSDIRPFDVFSYGKAAFAETEKETESYEENLRSFAEECDQLQGFQVLTDVLDGWGGFAAAYLEQLREDFPKTSILTYGLSEQGMAPGASMRHRQKRMLNESLAMSCLSELSTLYVPVQAPSRLNAQGWSKNLKFNPSNRFHTSALIAAGLDSALLPCRLRRGATLLPDLLGGLNWRNVTKIGSLSVAMPFPFGGKKLAPMVGPSSPLVDLSCPKVQPDDEIYSHVVVLRGLEAQQFAKYTVGTPRTPREVLDELLDSLPISKSLGDVKIKTPVKYPIPTSFPRFFQGLTPEGYQAEGSDGQKNERPDGTSIVYSAPVLSRLAITMSTRWQLQNMSESLRRVDWRLMPEYQGDSPGQGLTDEDFVEVKELLLNLYDIYDE
ncbi:mtDNA inheritance, partitioning of the mitochondrial organelle [Actinomortierella ambigua]|uniref:MtDNA inheritance, partitioning of the mitochondrial organelle n=1 Tax=Actinomortierella ambigua TaxID=1343610 RepID=A0A9P6QEP3_9FUNG|nr:mtDNA inheritance, partitioning of the mitochondrial organelle [Actinomortierella ambigua]